MGTLPTIILVAAAYIVLGAVSARFSIVQSEAWTVWLASGVTLGMLLERPRDSWAPVLIGAGAAAIVFALSFHTPVRDSVAYGVIEVVVAIAGATSAALIAPLPARFAATRDVGALVVGAFVLSLAGATLVGLWHALTSQPDAWLVFRVWLLGTTVGTLLVAPLVTSWLQVQPKRPDGLPALVGGAVACALFLVCLGLLFASPVVASLGGSIAEGLTYLPFVFFSVIGLLWGARGVAATALAGALLSIYGTSKGMGPFADREGFFGEANLEVQAYSAALAITGLLVSTLAEGQRAAATRARDWQTRFEATIGAHRLIAYEWDPAGGRFIATGDTVGLVGVPAGHLVTLADWLACVAAPDRDAVAARFGERGQSGVEDTLRYAVSGPSGPTPVVDEARAILDREGALHRIVGIVRAARDGT